jgi:hypothetical protein
MNSGAPKRKAVPAPLMAPIVSFTYLCHEISRCSYVLAIKGYMIVSRYLRGNEKPYVEGQTKQSEMNKGAKEKKQLYKIQFTESKLFRILSPAKRKERAKVL